MIIKCLVKNQILKRKDKFLLANKSLNNIKLEVEFKSSEWLKFNIIQGIFSNKNGQYRVLMNKENDNNYYCIVPSEVLTDEEFSISIAGGNLLTTNKINVYLRNSGVEFEALPNSSPTDIYMKIFEKLDSKYDNVSYENEYLSFYINDEVVKKIHISTIVDEIDPYFNNSPAKEISYNDMVSWNNKKDKSEIEDEYLNLQNYITS